MLKCVSKKKYTYWLISKETAQEIIDTLQLEETVISAYSIICSYEGKRMNLLFGQVIVRNGLDIEVYSQQDFLEKYATVG